MDTNLNDSYLLLIAKDILMVYKMNYVVICVIFLYITYNTSIDKLNRYLH